MSCFADSSALVKLYADEDGSEEIRALDAIAVSMLARVEVPAALWRKYRIGELSEPEARDLVGEFEADLLGTPTGPPAFAALSVSAAVLDRAAALLSLHDLRAYDAVQLASALAMQEADLEHREFACFDEQLRRAAAKHDLEILPRA